MTHVDLKGLAKQALTSKEIMANVKNAVSQQQKLNLTEKALFNFQDNGTVQVDIDGDGVYDVNVSGLVLEGGKVNTKTEGLQIGREEFNSFDFEAKEAEVENKKAATADYLKGNSFDEEKLQQTLKSTFGERESNLVTRKKQLDSELKALTDVDTSDMDEAQMEAHNKLIEAKNKEIANLNAEFSQLNGEKIALSGEIKGKFEAWQKAQTQLNNYLKAAGFDTPEARKAIKTKGEDGVRGGTNQPKGEEVKADKTIQEFVLEQAKAKIDNLIQRGVLTKEQVGENAEIVIDDKTGKVLVKFKNAGDNDNIEDFELSGIYDKKKGTIEFDTDKYGSGESERSSAKIAKLKADYSLIMAKITEGIQSGMPNKQLKKLNAELAEIKARLEDWKVSADNYKANKVE